MLFINSELFALIRKIRGNNGLEEPKMKKILFEKYISRLSNNLVHPCFCLHRTKTTGKKKEFPLNNAYH